MADIGITKFRVQIPRGGSIPSTPGFAQSEGQDPINPPGSPTGVYVPYLGATDNVNLGERGLTSGYVKLDTTPTGTPTDQGTISWSVAKSTAELIMNGTTQHIGQDSYYYVKNSTGSNIPKGTAVRFAGTDGASGHILITPFLANGSVPSSYFMGVTSEAIANGGFGQVTAFGELEGINTSGYTAGALLYASTTVAGGFQTTAPVAPNNIVLVAAAINSKNNGDIIVRPTIGSNINNDEGVKIVSPATGDLLQRQSNGLFENRTVAQVIGTLASKWTDVGSDIYRNSRVLIGGTTFNHANSILEIRHNTSNYLKGLTLINDASWGYGSRITFRVPLTSGGVTSNDAAAIEQNYDSSNNYNLSFYTTTSGSLTLKAVLNSGGNFLLGGSTDSGQRLQVTGNVALRASSTSSPATQIPVFVSDPASTNRELVTRTPAQLASDMGMSGTGIVYSNSGLLGVRTITAGNGITVTNGNGVSGNPTISLTPVTLPYESRLITDEASISITTSFANVSAIVNAMPSGSSRNATVFYSDGNFLFTQTLALSRTITIGCRIGSNTLCDIPLTLTENSDMRINVKYEIVWLSDTKILIYGWASFYDGTASIETAKYRTAEISGYNASASYSSSIDFKVSNASGTPTLIRKSVFHYYRTSDVLVP